jgi:type 1 glutamine amidotransferase
MKTFPSLLAAGLVLASAFTLHAAEPKRVIVCTVTTGFRHSSIPYAEKTLQKLADESHAYTIVAFARQPDVQIPRKPNKPKDLAKDTDEKAQAKYESEMKKYSAELEKWTPEIESSAKDAQAKFDSGVKESLSILSPENLEQQKIDGVIFANTTGMLPLPDPEGFIKWIQAGHAFIGMHSASDTFHQFAPYIEMLGGEFAGHGAQVPADLNNADPSHPATAGLPEQWNLLQEEMYQFKNHDPAKVHVLWYLKHPPQQKEVKEYAGVSWCKAAGQGRVFYTSLGHREDLWSTDEIKDRKNTVELAGQYQQHILGGIQWALGLAEGNATPNNLGVSLEAK